MMLAKAAWIEKRHIDCTDLYDYTATSKHRINHGIIVFNNTKPCSVQSNRIQRPILSPTL